MKEDIYEPLIRYRDEFREKFAALTDEYFRKLSEKSGVDPERNRHLVSEINDLTERKNKAESAVRTRRFLIFLLFLSAAGGIGLAVWDYMQLQEKSPGDFFQYLKNSFSGVPWSLIGVCLLAVSLFSVFKWAIPACRRKKAELLSLEDSLSRKTAEAWDQMKPLNDLYDWGIPARLIEKTVPRIEFDPYFTLQRLTDLKESFGWNDDYNSDKSVLCSHSGTINGNPFVFATLKKMHWGTKTYTGTKTISWTERVSDSNGKTRIVHRTQTLVATVEKPCPYYSQEKILLYGNDAAPDLSFSRTPSSLSGGSGVVNSLRKKSEQRKLEKFSRNLDDDSDFTMMSNKEFEVLFHADDRDHEVQFRLLFTPLAQQQMVKLLNDKTIGYGDDFFFQKKHRVNMIQAYHLDQLYTADDPSVFHNYSLEGARTFFRQFNETFFKVVYFALAPLLTIPLYQQTRTRKAIYGNAPAGKSSFWEHEAAANYCGEEKFKHPASITENILKVYPVSDQEDGSSLAEVTAFGHAGKKRVDTVSVRGGDGRYHSVPVEWIEYFPVDRTTRLHLMENDPRGGEADAGRVDEIAGKWKTKYGNLICRRSVFVSVER